MERIFIAVQPRMSLVGALLTLFVAPTACTAAEIDLRPNRLEFSMPVLVGRVGSENVVLLLSGTRSFCAPKSHGKPERATLYLFDPANYTGRSPEIVNDTAAGCFVITGALNKSCVAGDEKCFRALPRATAAFHYPITKVTTNVPIPAPPPMQQPLSKLTSVDLCTPQSLAEARVCSMQGKRLAHVSARVEPVPETEEQYDMIPDYDDPNGPCVSVKARGAGKKVGQLLIPTQWPVTPNSPKITIDRCKEYPGGQLKIEATYSNVGQVN